MVMTKDYGEEINEIREGIDQILIEVVGRLASIDKKIDESAKAYEEAHSRYDRAQNVEDYWASRCKVWMGKYRVEGGTLQDDCDCSDCDKRRNSLPELEEASKVFDLAREEFSPYDCWDDDDISMRYGLNPLILRMLTPGPTPRKGDDGVATYTALSFRAWLRSGGARRAILRLFFTGGTDADTKASKRGDREDYTSEPTNPMAKGSRNR